jgi:ketosteroid isomerase-like protein
MNSAANVDAKSATMEAERALYQAMIKKDYAALEQILSPDLVYVHSTAVAESKVEYLAGMAKGLYEYESIATRDTRIRVHGDVTLVDGFCDMRVGVAGQPKGLIHLLFVLVWVRDGVAWRLEHRHATRLPAS